MVQFRRGTQKSRLIYHLAILFPKKVKISPRSGQKDQGQIRRFEVLGPGTREP